MISDVLYEAVEGIDYYLNDPIFKGVYVGRLRTELMAMRDHMELLRTELDAAPVIAGLKP